MLTKSVITASAGLIVALPMGPALAKDNRAEVRTSGQCTSAAVWKLKAKEDDGGVEVEFEIDTNVVGQAWDYTLSGPSGVLSSGTRTTTAPSGSFSVEVQSTGAVTDAFVGVATFNGQTCDTTISSPAPNPNPSPSTSDDTPGSDDNGGGHGSDDTPGTDDNGGSRTGSDDTIDGTCSDDSSAMLRVKGKKATLRVDADSRGEKWRYEIRRDGKVVKQGTARTKGSKAVFKVKAKSKTGGSFTASANRVGSDDSCEISA